MSISFYYDNKRLSKKIAYLQNNELSIGKNLLSKETELISLKNQDQYLINKKLEAEINSIQRVYKKAVFSYENLLDLKEKTQKTEKIDELFSKTLSFLAEKNYSSAEANLKIIDTAIQEENNKTVAEPKIPQNITNNNTPPAAGYQRQRVQTEIGSFIVDIISADLSSTRIVVDTASDSDCKNDCPVLPLSDYVSRNEAYAGINGSYFCPSTYPSCTDKKNSFDTLLMNKSKTYFNSDNNVYSTVPAVIFGSGWIRFVKQSLEWGRDTSIDSMIANQPLLILGGNIAFGGDDDPKKGTKGTKSFISNKGNTVYIGIAHSVTVAENAYVLKAMGMDNALNLDSGGSTALWYSGYKAGPGRNIPNAILFIRK